MTKKAYNIFVANGKPILRVALIGDVHGNLPALEAVLADIRRRKLAEIWNIGDFVGYGPFPDDVVRRLREVNAKSTIGNYDRKALDVPKLLAKWEKKKKDPLKIFAFRWAYEHLSPDSRRYLRKLPFDLRFTVQGRRALLVHGSPGSLDEHLTPATPASRLKELARTAKADVVVVGHSHQPFVRQAGGVWFVNTGSVGRPDDGDWRATYAILEFTAGGVAVEHVRLPYDLGRTLRAMREAKLPEPFVQMLLQGRALDDIQAQAALQTPPPAKKLRAVLAVAESYDYEHGHSRQVTNLALQLFDRLLPWHGLSARERFLLHSAGLLHDIGWVEGRKGHHKTAMRLILASDLPFGTRSRRIIALIARYHRRSLPRKKDAVYGRLSGQDRSLVRLLAGILRVADGLDVRHLGNVKCVSCKLSADGLTILCHSRGDCTPERQAGLKKGDLLAKALNKSLAIEAGYSLSAGESDALE